MRKLISRSEAELLVRAIAKAQFWSNSTSEVEDLEVLKDWARERAQDSRLVYIDDRRAS